MSPLDIRSLRILLSFLVLTGLPLVAFAWLGWRFLQQDRDLELQRQREQLQSASELLVRELRTQLETAERVVGLHDGALGAPSGSGTAFQLRSGQLVERRGMALPFYPSASPRQVEMPVFETAERQEFDGQCQAALVTYVELSRSARRDVRAGALVRTARCLRKLNRDAEALETYNQLKTLGDIAVAGMPAELLAKRERIDLLAKTGQAAAARAEEQALRASLHSGTFGLDRGTYEFLSEKAGSGEEPGVELPLALAGEAWSSRWQTDGCGRLAEEFSGVPVVGLWCRSGDDVRVLLVRADDLLGPVARLAESMQVAFGIHDAGGRAIWGAALTEPTAATRQLSDLALPWRLNVQAANPARAAALLPRRRALAASGLALMIAIVASAGFFVFRAVNRELEIARLQSDFISTVSHEFRTPLTAMNHLTEMLIDAAVPADRVPQYYAALHRETNRLHRVVESLLDFRRFESGRHAYRMEPMEAQDAVRQAVDSYATREDSARLHLSLDGERATIRGDRDAVAVAVSNLVDNALKYSPADAPVSIQVAPHGSMVGITVEDRGPGLSRHEQRRVFRKFVRGSAAHEANVKGTGIGLAIVEAVVKAHGGRVDLDSVPGQGTRFTLLLPRA